MGKRIVEEEQGGDGRAEYSKKVLENLSAAITADFGRGYSLRNISNFRLFYLKFPELPSIRQTLSAELSRSHYQLFMNVIRITALLYKQLFATKYLQYLHMEGELIAEIEREKLMIQQRLGYEIKLWTIIYIWLITEIKIYRLLTN